MSGSIVRQCAVCAQEFRIHPSTVAKRGLNGGRCCSRACNAVFRVGKPSPKPRKTDAENEARLWARVERRGPDDCWEWQGGTNAWGYGVLSVNGKHIGAHRYAYVLANGPIAGGLSVLHECDNRRCCNTAHHFLGTRGDNARDMKAKGRAAKGERHSQARLTECGVLAIRELHAGGVPSGKLKALFGPAVYHVIKGATWTHLKEKAANDQEESSAACGANA